MLGEYILEGHTPVLASDLRIWGQWFESAGQDRVVKQEHVLGGLCWVSTVFLGLDHNFFGGPPLLFETMAFWEDEGGYEQERCSTWEAAEKMHRQMVKDVQKPSVVWQWFVRRVQEVLDKMKEDWQRSGI